MADETNNSVIGCSYWCKGDKEELAVHQYAGPNGKGGVRAVAEYKRDARGVVVNGNPELLAAGFALLEGVRQRQGQAAAAPEMKPQETTPAGNA